MTRHMPADPAIGTWKLNLLKSSFQASSHPKSYLMRVETWEDGFKVSADIVEAHGNELHQEAAYKLDGKDYPLKGSPLADTVSAKRINERTEESLWKKDGEVILTLRNVISADGKTLNQTMTAGNVKGWTPDDLLVFDKQ